MTTLQLTDNIKTYISTQIEQLSNGNPIIGFLKPLVMRALDKNFSKVHTALDLIADENGNIDAEAILTEMIESIRTSQPFTFNTSFIGDIELGGGSIKFNLPFTNKKLILGMSDLEMFKEILTTKSE